MNDENTGLFRWIRDLVAGSPAERSKPTTSKSQTRDAWLCTDACLHYQTQVFDNLVQFRHGQHMKFDCKASYPNLQVARGTVQGSDGNTSAQLRKRKGDQTAIIEEFQCLDTGAKRRRLLARKEPDEDVDASEAAFALLARKRSMSLYQALRTHWTCVCQGCSRFGMRLSLPPHWQSPPLETSFEVFFGVQSLAQVSWQEAKITVKDQGINRSGVNTDSSPFHICQSIAESLGQQNCLHLMLENGLFKRLRPQPKTFGDFHHPQTVSLSDLFKHQQELSGGASVLPLMGKRVLAFVLATALFPLLETPWVQPTLNHSNIQFLRPSREGGLPDITKPFLDMQQIPASMAANRADAKDNETEVDCSKHLVHPNASVLALGILLCELHYCRPIESWQDDPETSRNVNTRYYTSLEVLKDLEVDAGIDYYLATRACLQWEYLPSGEHPAFESASVQKMFYQKVVRRLASEISMWDMNLEKLQCFSDRDNQRCWGRNGSEVVRQHTTRYGTTTSAMQKAPAVSRSPVPKATAVRYSPALIPNCSLRSGPLGASESLYFFDAAHRVGSVQDIELSDRWMDNLLTSVYKHVDPYEAFMPPSMGSLTSSGTFRPVRIAILDSGFDLNHPLLRTDQGGIDARVKGFRNFVSGRDSAEYQDETGHGTHALGLILKVATCAEIYIARVANQATIGRESYDAITKASSIFPREAIDHAVTEWNVDIISMSFGIREYNQDMKEAISNARHKKTLMFAAASNDGANHGRAFPAKDRGVFCIHSADGNGNPSGFNPTAEGDDSNFCVLGEHVQSHWPAGKNGHNDSVRVMSGTSVATPIAAGLAASLLSLVKQHEHELGQNLPAVARLWSWLKDVDSMEAVFRSMVRGKRGAGYDYIVPHFLLRNKGSSREVVYNKIKELRDRMFE